MKKLTLGDLEQQKATVLAAKDRMSAMLQLFCAQHCPVKVGDIIECNGYSFRGRRMKVTKVFVKDSTPWRDEKPRYEYVAKGAIIKKDGTPSDSQEGEWKKDIHQPA